MRRREFLGKLAASGAALASTTLGGLPGLSVRRARASSTPWGDYPADLLDVALPPQKRAKKVLEVFCHGGMSPWESLYVVDDPAYGKADKLMWWTFREGEGNLPDAFAACVPGDTGPLLVPFATDQLGAQVKFGPMADPLRRRADIVGRLRMHVMSHNLFPHDVAQSLAQTGTPTGQPRMSGIGTPVGRYFATHAGATPSLPIAYVIGEAFTDNALTTGTHPAQYRPMRLTASRLNLLASNLDVLVEAEKSLHKGPLLDLYTEQFRRRLAVPWTDTAVRAPALSELAFAIALRKNFGAFADVFGEKAWSLTEAQVCGGKQDFDPSRLQLELAAFLLNLPDQQTRHVMVIDRAYDRYVANPDGYDSHQRYVSETTRKYPYFWTRLLDSINEPGEGDPTKIDLDDTLVVVNTEFGRSPGVQLPDGRNHYPLAYVTLMFGGPVGPDQRGIVGAIDEYGLPHGELAPAETRAAVLAAMGIYPFAADVYSPYDVPDAVDALDASVKLREVVLGVGA
ncbi:MAG: DUF1501 domain-containing protein [Deltaproteobacteria bacterium]|nr:DUF1501 domain-containing protein [Deltaproteobacteria bacterium]